MSDQKKGQYPECEKLELFNREQMNALYEFIEYMDGNIEATFVDEENKPRISCSEDILYDFLKIDKVKLEKERQSILKSVQS